jgi:hypothetical protein
MTLAATVDPSLMAQHQMWSAALGTLVADGKIREERDRTGSAGLLGHHVWNPVSNPQTTHAMLCVSSTVSTIGMFLRHGWVTTAA